MIRLGKCCEEERQGDSHHLEAEEARCECLSEKKYKATRLNISKNYGPI